MKRSISNNKKSPVNTNNNEDEVNIDVNLLLNDPKSLHKMLNKKSDDNDYVPTGANPNKLSNRPKKPYKGRPYYYDEGLWEGKKPRKGQQYELGNIKKRTEDKQERIAKEQLEKLNAMRTAKKKEEMDDIPEFAPYAKKKYSDKREYNKAGELLNKGVHTMQDGAVKGYDKGKELISDFIKDTKKDGVGETLRKGVHKTEDLIIDFIKNNKTIQKLDEKLGPIGDYIRSIDPSFPDSKKDAELKKKNNR